MVPWSKFRTDMDCFICCVFCVLSCSETLYYSVLLFFFCVVYCSLLMYCTVSAYDVRAATLTEGFPHVFSSFVRQIPEYNSQRRGKARSSQISYFLLLCVFNFLLLCMFRSLYSVYCLCVNVYWTTATGCQSNCN
jgi:hypothetical protein